MANEEQLALLRCGVETWNQWRAEHPDEVIDLRGADLSESNLLRVNLSGADLSGAVLRGANLHVADLRSAVLAQADLSKSVLTETQFQGADLTDCRIYGIAAWGLALEDARQKDLVITRWDESAITVDNLEVAQFVYLLLKNEKIRDVINTIGKKAILILGRFTPEPRKQVLDALRDALRDRGYLPIVFDFERPTDADFTETIKTLVGLCLFVIADVTNPRSIPLELQATVPDYMLPFVPIIQKGEASFAMLSDLLKYPWVLKPVLSYESADQLVARLDDLVVGRALRLHHEMLQRRVQALPIQDIGELPVEQ